MTEHEQILMAVKKCRRVDLYVDSRPLTSNEKGKIVSIVEKREHGEPLQYLLGHCEFRGLTLKVDNRVLIPRPETETLVEKALERIKDSKAPLCILDIGTGSGNIAISLAKEIDNVFVYASDISQNALKIAQENALLNSVSKKVKFVRSDLFSQFNHSFYGFFDMMISNPPYIETHVLSTLPVDVQREPRLALDGGKDGLKFYRNIIPNSVNFLKPGGVLAFEIGEDQKESIERIFSQNKKFESIKTFKDDCGRNRIMTGEKCYGKISH